MGLRVDQLLHWLCLAKSRSLVARACQEGRVRVNEARVKPAKEVRPGDRITISERLREDRRVIEILELPSGQTSRRDAPRYYRLLEPPDAAGGSAGAGEMPRGERGPRREPDEALP